MDSLYLKPNEERRLIKGHLWVFNNELQTVPKNIPAGEIVTLFTHDHRPIGAGFYNPHSLIAFRLLTHPGETPDQAFFRKKILEAAALREKIYPPEETNAWRLVHGESDGLPGLVADRFHQAVVLQAFSAGMDRLLPMISEVIDDLLKPEAIIVRNESALRELEGLPLSKDILKGDRSATVQTIFDAGVFYEVDLYEGQKTGFFLDQRENRRTIRKFSAGADVLDVFANDGGFALNALFAGARSATLVDISEETLNRAQKNARLNKFENFHLMAGDAFALLSRMAEEKKAFDVVVLDPPSFTKSRKNLPAALKAYKKLNKLGLRLIKPGGFLATASCSHHVSEADFFQVIHQAALGAGKQLRLIHKSAQPPDHPVLLAMPETGYLKFACFQVTGG
ncbi:MAG: SAM-dependent methyltransferase [Desulfobacterales bacterium CG23_combo_of_CG06-09_8_20_14_all_51_8]|nr:MAG: SAM-dependent methyltransferase [Desulfobacterales bacterium CG23_combo_of_CG06-09_8_20_14_all_51_8]